MTADTDIPTETHASILVRDSAAGDLPSIQAIYAHHVRHGSGSFELNAPEVDEIGRRREQVLANGFPHLVAESGTQVLGFAYVGPYRLRPAYRFCVESSIYVAPGAVRRGIGRMLLQDLIARSESLGLRQMIAVIGDSANTGSIGLHAACGFRFAGLLRATGWKFDRWLDSVLMQRELGAGDRAPPSLADAGRR